MGRQGGMTGRGERGKRYQHWLYIFSQRRTSLLPNGDSYTSAKSSMQLDIHYILTRVVKPRSTHDQQITQL